MKSHVRRHEVIQPLDQSIKLIPLTKGQNAIVDAEDYESLMQWNWNAKWDQETEGYYARRAEQGKTIYMSRILVPDAQIVDHRNHNTLDNRKNNLRACTPRQNRHNSRGFKKRRSRYKGVYRVVTFRAEIKVNGKRIRLGEFSNEDEAAKAYDAAAIKYFGEFAHINLP